MAFERPVICNYTRPAVGPDVAEIGIGEFTRRVGSNTGNMAFLHALTLTVENLVHVSERALQDADVKVWGCSNFIASHRAMSVTKAPLYTDGKPMVAIGLGAQSRSIHSRLDVPEQTREWIEAIGEMAPSDGPNISLRGEYTYSVLKEHGLHGRAVVLGCPSLFIHSSRDLGALIRQKLESPVSRIGVAPGNITHLAKRVVNLERRLADIASAAAGSYLVQHPPGLFRILAGAPLDDELLSVVGRVRDMILPSMSRQDFLSWLFLHGRLFDNVPSWLFHLRSLDLVVGTRFHGIQLALQAGTPAFCIALDSRQVELCRHMKVPYREFDELGADFGVEDIRRLLLDFDWEGFDANRRVCARRFADFLGANMLTPSRHLISLG